MPDAVLRFGPITLRRSRPFELRRLLPLLNLLVAALLLMGTAFAVWAPAARAVSVVGDFNSWDGRLHAMRSLGSTGIWELFLPGVEPGARYKYEILAADGELTLKADPYAQEAELPPKTASVVTQSHSKQRAQPGHVPVGPLPSNATKKPSG